MTVHDATAYAAANVVNNYMQNYAGGERTVFINNVTVGTRSSEKSFFVCIEIYQYTN